MKLNYNDFKEEISRRITEFFNGSISVEFHKVAKNNVGEMDAMTILDVNTDDAILPNFYINQIYKAYVNADRDVADVVNDIIEKYDSLKIERRKININVLDNYKNIHDKVIYRIINTEMNKIMLKDVPHINWLDLSIVFYIVAGFEEGGMYSIRITNSMLHDWNIGTMDLIKNAYINTKRLMPLKINSLNGVIENLIFNGNKNNSDDKDVGMKNITKEIPIVISNSKGINGFSVLLYDGVLKNLADKLGVDRYFILPSSVHEAIIVCESVDNKSIAALREVVKEANNDVVEDMDILSDNVYLYDRKADIVTIAKEDEV